MDEPTREQLVFYNNLYKTENVQLHEEIVYLKELNNGLDYCAEQESLKNKQLKDELEAEKDYGDNWIQEHDRLKDEREQVAQELRKFKIAGDKIAQDYNNLKEEFNTMTRSELEMANRWASTREKLDEIEELFKYGLPISLHECAETIGKIKKIIAGKKL